MKNDKERMLKAIDEAIHQEEIIIPIYTSHLESTIFLSGMTSENRKEILDGLRNLADESLGHARALKRIKEKIEKGVYDNKE